MWRKSFKRQEIDLETGAILSVTVQEASEGDSATLPETLTMAAEQVEAVQPDGAEVEEVVADKGYHSDATLVALDEIGVRSYVSEPERGRRCWQDKKTGETPVGKRAAQKALYGNRGWCYLPMLGFLSFDREAEQYLCAAVLRPGKAVAPDGTLGLLCRLLPLLRAAFPRARFLVRLDGGFATPEITDLLWDVHAFTGFLDAFTDLRSGRVHANPAALLASILAGATNLGLERMARASSGVSHAQLSWASAWCLRSETYANALARIIDAHHALPVASVWGSTSRTSSDGQFFASGRRNAGEINAKYGPDPGLKIYSFLSGRYGSFHSNVIGATAGEAPFVLDGLVGNAAPLDYS